MGVELLLRAEGRAVDALQLLVRLVALPVDARRLEQLDRTDLGGPLGVRTPAEVEEAAMPIEGDRLALGNVLETLDLQPFAHLAQALFRLISTHLDALVVVVLGEDLAHHLFDALQVLGCEGTRKTKVVLELFGVVLTADVDLDVGPQSLHRVCQDVFGAMANKIAALRITAGEEAEGSTVTQGLPQIDHLTIELGTDRRLRQPRSDRPGDVQRRRARSHLLLATVRQRQDDVRVRARHGIARLGVLTDW